MRVDRSIAYAHEDIEASREVADPDSRFRFRMYYYNDKHECILVRAAVHGDSAYMRANLRMAKDLEGARSCVVVDLRSCKAHAIILTTPEGTRTILKQAADEWRKVEVNREKKR